MSFTTAAVMIAAAGAIDSVIKGDGLLTPSPIRPRNCVNCGAPHEDVCSYCATPSGPTKFANPYRTGDEPASLAEVLFGYSGISQAQIGEP